MTRGYAPFLVLAAGSALGALLALTSLAVMTEVSDEMLLAAYTIVVLLVSASLMPSARYGLMFALVTITAEAVTELVYLVSTYHVDVSLLPYAAGLVLFIGRIPLFILAGVLGGYLGRTHIAERKTEKKSVAKDATRRMRK
jgi:hypothetical protein